MHVPTFAEIESEPKREKNDAGKALETSHYEYAIHHEISLCLLVML